MPDQLYNKIMTVAGALVPAGIAAITMPEEANNMQTYLAHVGATYSDISIPAITTISGYFTGCVIDFFRLANKYPQTEALKSAEAIDAVGDRAILASLESALKDKRKQ